MNEDFWITVGYITAIIFFVGLFVLSFYMHFFGSCDSWWFRYMTTANIPARCLTIVK